MNRWELRPSLDLGPWALALAGLLALVSVWLFALELRRSSAARSLWVSFALSLLFLLGAIARPVMVSSVGQKASPLVAVLMDRSYRLALSTAEGPSRAELAQRALAELQKHFRGARLAVFGFGEGELLPEAPAQSRSYTVESDLSRGLELLLARPGEAPQAVVVMSDGRLTAPGAELLEQSESGKELEPPGQTADSLPPVHTVSLTEQAPHDRSIRKVLLPGTVIAHQSFQLEVELGCDDKADCQEVPVEVTERLAGEAPRALGRALARGSEGLAKVQLPVTLDRAGSRVIEVRAQAMKGDAVPDNDVRYLPVEVRRDRLRILHVAGRPTYDVRSLRTFLKGDESIDLVSFFILRTLGDRVSAPNSELALIPFPVDELFSEHLPSFDCVILQDIDAREYGLEPHFAELRSYVRHGGGLILVGGPDSFGAGGYADSPLAEVLPISIPLLPQTVSPGVFRPRTTLVGKRAPVLAQLMELTEGELPEVSGANRVGPARATALVLWEHPTEKAVGTELPMPILALGEAGDGRSIAFAMDGSHLLRFGELGGKTAGRAYGALWEGLLGWLMREPRFEVAQFQRPEPCLTGLPFALDLRSLPRFADSVSLTVSELGAGNQKPLVSQARPLDDSGRAHFDFEGLAPGAYAAQVRLGSSPPTRMVFACEKGGDAWADSRPDPKRLQAVARHYGGQAVRAEAISELPEPAPTLVLAQSATRSLLPDSVWALGAASCLGLHFFLRRRNGLL